MATIPEAEIDNILSLVAFGDNDEHKQVDDFTITRDAKQQLTKLFAEYGRACRVNQIDKVLEAKPLTTVDLTLNYWKERIENMKSELSAVHEQGENLTCTSCGKTDNTVHERACGYSEDVNNDPNDIEIVCDACEHEHIMDI